MKYFVVVQAPAYPLGEERFSIESAFAIHLQELRKLIGPAYSELVLIGPALSKQQAVSQSAHMTTLELAGSGIRFLPAFPLDVSRARFLLRRWTPTWRWLKQQFAGPCVVHSGMSTELSRPLMFMASLAGWRMGRPVMFMVDMDWRMHARRFRRTGEWGLGTYLVNRLAYDPLKWIQLWLAPRLFDVCCFKGDTLVRDFGRGRPNVHKFHDTVHGASDVLTGPQLDARLEWIHKAAAPLRIAYFGRLAANKGIDRIIEAVQQAGGSGTDIRLRIIGDGDQAESLQALVRTRNLQARVEFIGAVPWGAPLFALLEDQHLCVMAPLIEDTPRAAFDAFCRGLPIVAFDIAFFRDLAAESGAVVTTPWPQAGGLAQAFTQLSVDREALARRSADAVAFAARNTQQIWLERRLGWLREAQQRKGQ
jgi:glycosyltransferase involved in cell wall biosynthesis